TLLGVDTCHDGKESYYELCWFEGRVRLEEHFGPPTLERIGYDQPPPSECGWKKEEWNTYEIQLRKAEVRMLVNGRQVFAEPRPASRTGGFVGLTVQNCKALFRKVELVPR